VKPIGLTFHYTVRFLSGYWTGNQMHSILAEAFKFTVSHTSFIQWRCSNDS